MSNRRRHLPRRLRVYRIEPCPGCGQFSKRDTIGPALALGSRYAHVRCAFMEIK